MRRAVPPHRIARHHLLLHRPPPPRAGGPDGRPVRPGDLILAVLGVALLGGYALLAAGSLLGRTLAP